MSRSWETSMAIAERLIAANTSPSPARMGAAMDRTPAVISLSVDVQPLDVASLERLAIAMCGGLGRLIATSLQDPDSELARVVVEA